ncbi:hypothetical protein ACFQ3W_06110 [Paenibacillus puldeungensis]|uniref:Knr4/Smi1-like domain-containing protein n=1 Tax=Paenibacillus puldeungensis TaxID=696536 RepID=A0ABW3RTS8_9BACL
MERLGAALKRFLEQQDQYNITYGLFKNHDIRLREAPFEPVVDQRIPLSAELEYFYTRCEIRDASAEGTLKMKSAAVEIGDAAVLFFAAPEHLQRQQLGFRWIGQNEPYRESETWQSQHVVIANFNDDPLIVDTSSQDSPVYACVAGANPECVAASLADFFIALAILIEGAYAFGGEVKDGESFETKETYLELVEPPLWELLGKETTAHLIDYLSL